MRLVQYLFAVSILFLSTLSATAQQTNDSPDYGQLLEAYEEVHGFSGTVKVVLDDEEVFQQSYGLANRSFEIPNTPTTRNSINSISKTFTAVAVLKMVQAGKIDLDIPIGAYLSGLTAPWKDQITVHQLLSHTSGLPREAGLNAWEELFFEEQVRKVNELELLFEPGEEYQYSNAGFILLGAILEAVGEKSYSELITENIIEPLGLENTGVYQGRTVVAQQAVPYTLGVHGIEEAQRTKIIGPTAGGGLYSTPDDLYRFMLALEKGELLPDTLQAKLFEAHVQTSENEAEGYAFSIKQFGDDTIRMAAGSGYGTKSVMIREPEPGLFIAVVSNWGNTPVLDILRDLYLSSLGQDVTPPESKQLANPAEYKEHLGLYQFDPEQMKTYLQMESSQVRLRNVDGKLFMNEEVLAKHEDGTLGLAYTRELGIHFEANKMILIINGNELVGEKVE
ncbi:serine hydrolase domain-containing protein [Gracilimonas mengyeensis]|uniref:CubicO group peptidase, beta-lactamase class C family n=1 Tax=Gracilimonas mengyeensis TaxID=1302730 RepID=A0A521B0H5_9BACT|nr:serine hydrolase domain-containing protein [Gracilimonas mengyeensis]SMO40604.1 CubicO group peptidase, beta-lactamase class C family [Gracilimonas mengyeensis]